MSRTRHQIDALIQGAIDDLDDRALALRSLYIAGTPIDPAGVADALDRTLRDQSEGWRGLASYADGVDAVGATLRRGHGLLMEAPEPVCAAVAAVLERRGVSASILGSSLRRSDVRVLVLGRSYMVAGAFAFERRAERQ